MILLLLKMSKSRGNKYTKHEFFVIFLSCIAVIVDVAAGDSEQMKNEIQNRMHQINR